MARSSMTLTGPHQLHPHRPVDRTRQAWPDPSRRSRPPLTRRARHRPQPDEPAGRLPLTLESKPITGPLVTPRTWSLSGSTPQHPPVRRRSVCCWPCTRPPRSSSWAVSPISACSPPATPGAPAGSALGPRLTPPAVAALKPAWQPPPNPARPTTLSPMTGGCTFGNPSNLPVLPGHDLPPLSVPVPGRPYRVVKTRPVQVLTGVHLISLDLRRLPG